MNEIQKTSLLKLLEYVDIYALTQLLNIEYNLIIKEDRNSYYSSKNDFTENALELLFSNPLFSENFIISLISFNNDSISRNQSNIIKNCAFIYKHINNVFDSDIILTKLFKNLEPIFLSKNENVKEYNNDVIKFYAYVLNFTDYKNVKNLFEIFNNLPKKDNCDIFPLVKSFIDRGIDCELVFNSISLLNNQNLESKIIAHLNNNGIKHNLELKEISFLEEEDIILYQKKINISLNFFMRNHITEKDSFNNMNKFIDNFFKNKNIHYSSILKNKKLILNIKSENKELLDDISNSLKNNELLINEYVTNLGIQKNPDEYSKKFFSYLSIKDLNNIKTSPSNSKINKI